MGSIEISAKRKRLGLTPEQLFFRPSFYGAVWLFAIVAFRMLFAIPFVLAGKLPLGGAAVTLMAATAAGAFGGLSCSVKGFRLAQFASVPECMARLGPLPAPTTPRPDALWAFVQREYPDLASALAPR